MKRKNVKAGQRVIIKRSTSEVWPTAARHIGEEFTVARVEGLDYTEEGTVLVQKVGDDSVRFWCNHRDLRKAEKEPAEAAAPAPGQEAPPSAPKVGDLFRVQKASDYHGFSDGAVIRLRAIEPDGIHDFEDFFGRMQFVESSNLTPLSKGDIWEILKAQGAAEELPKMSWPYPEGTLVLLTDEGKAKAHRFGKDPDSVYILGSDGTTVPPLFDQALEHMFYVNESMVKPA